MGTNTSPSLFIITISTLPKTSASFIGLFIKQLFLSTENSVNVVLFSSRYSLKYLSLFPDKTNISPGKIFVEPFGTITPILAKKLDLIDNDESVLKTFNDYKENKSTSLIEFTIDKNNIIANKMIMDANIPEDILVVMIKRNGDVFVPNGSTK